jgi:uncharacterized glyoxalase superfamily protein PhnB
MSESPSPSRPVTYVWPSLGYHDAPAAIEFLTRAFGFVATAVHKSENDDTVVDHAELAWPPGGGIMLGTQRKSAESPGSTGHASCYVVTDDPDGLYTRAVSAGASVVQELTDQDYGSREFSVRDPEGNLWIFGTYAGE